MSDCQPDDCGACRGCCPGVSRYGFVQYVWIEGDSIKARPTPQDSDVTFAGEMVTKLTDGALPGSVWVDEEEQNLYYVDEAQATRRVPLKDVLEKGVITKRW